MSSRSRTLKQSRFSRIPGPSVQRSVFNRSHGNKLTLDAGLLVPFFIDEALPGDTMAMNTSLFGRIATLIQPIMDNLYLDTHYFAVPYRIVWDNWEKFMGEQENPGDSTDFVIPRKDTIPAGAAIGSLEDYFGIPTGIGELRHSALPFRAYNLIWNEWFRDQNMQDSVPVPTDDGPDGLIGYAVLPRGKRHDYFTSCLPFAQKGDAVEIPLGDTAPLFVDTLEVVPAQGAASAPTFQTANANGPHTLEMHNNDTLTTWNPATDTSGPQDQARWLDPQLRTQSQQPAGFADLSAATSITVNLLRESITLQQMLEKDARGGTRYAEIVRSHFGVISPDARLQRPEYLGGSTQPLNVHTVANTAGDTGSPDHNQADLAAYGTISGSGAGWRKSFTEHSIIIGLVSLRADLNYQQGLEKLWTRSTRYEFYWPTFAHLGEQAVLNKEIYAQGALDPTADDEVFGYQERFAEYRYKPNQITGLFRSQAPESLDVWHLAQDFQNLPVLDDTFIVEKPPVDRVIAVPSEPHVLLDTHMSYRCARPMPSYSVPGLRRF